MSMSETAAAERLQKILSRLGIASRRRAEEMITEGAVTVNGRVAQLGDKAIFGQDSIKVNGRLLVHAPSPVYYAFYKPRQVICAMEDMEGRPTLAEYLDRIKTRVYPVGRMDFMSEGLLLLTNDGEMLERIQKHPDIVRVYHVKVKGHPNEEMLERIRRGVKLLEPTPKLLKPYRVRLVDKFQQKALVEVVVRGSGAFDVKALFEARGFLVERVARFALGQITLRDLKPGEFMSLERTQVEALIAQTDLVLTRLEQDAQKQAEKQLKQEKSARAREARSHKRITPSSETGARSAGPRSRIKTGARSAAGAGPRSRAGADRRGKPSRGAPEKSGGARSGARSRIRTR